MRVGMVLLAACSSGAPPEGAAEGAPGSPPAAQIAPAVPEAVAEAAPAGSIDGDPILAEPTVLGGVPAAEVGATLAAAQAALDGCYTAELAKDPGLAGKVLVRFAIGADGHVSSARVKATSLWHEPTEACLVRTIQGLTFVRPPADGTAIITWPFSFGPAATTPR